jgi:C-terminal processing protease CtpA/Prc
MDLAKSQPMRVMVAFLAMIYSALAVLAQKPDEAVGPALDSAACTKVIEAVLQKLIETYVLPEVAKKMEASIRTRMRSGRYDGIREGKLLADKLTNDLREISHDKHLHIYYSPTPISEHKEKELTTAEKEKIRAAYRKRGDEANWGFEKVERLDGNIGYLKFRLFADPEFTGDTLACAMRFLCNTNALIVDVRTNSGGEPAMVALVCSYFFSGEPVHLGDLYWRPDASTTQYWTLPYVPGERYVDKEVYVLISKETISAAEAFAYNLKMHKRATLIGEATAGYAHPGSNVRISDHFSAIIPQGRSINAISKTDWEGTGVKPDIEVPAAQALSTAYVIALKNALGKETDDQRTEQLRKALKTAQEDLESQKSKNRPK